MSVISESLLSELRRLLSRDRVVTDPAELLVYESDGFTIARARPGAVVFPLSTEEVSAVMRTLTRHGAQIVPRGSGTGLTGGCVAFDDGVIILTARMTRILKIDLDNRAAHVEAGVRNTALSDAVAQAALAQAQLVNAQSADAGGTAAASPTSSLQPAVYHFAPDPSSQRASTIGGNAATNAGGIHTLKDFCSSNHVLGVEMVLADGSVVQIGAKDGAYDFPGDLDLPGLICGSEGTFGIITKLWVRLVPKANHFRTLVAMFSTSQDACNTVSDVIAAGILPSAMEMLDGRMVQVVEDAFHFGIPPEAQAMILTEIDGIDALLDGQVRQIVEICQRHGAMSVETSSDEKTRARMWKMRKSAFGAIGRISQSYCTQDACVPRSMLAQVLTQIDRIGREHGLAITNVFHAGDGNVHPIFLYDDRDQQQVQNILQAAEKILQYCIDVGGTLTGEHGVGVEKIHLMSYLFDAPTMEQFQLVKHAFDPDEHINAGKLIPSEKIRVRLLKPGRMVPQ